MKIPIIFLGTGQAVPTSKRNHSSILLRYKQEAILFDCGEGTQRQFRKAKINPCKLTRLLITHWHGDHVLGVPGLLQTLMLNNYSKTLYIYGPKGTRKFFNLMFKIFVKVGKIKTEVKEISKGKVFETPEFIIEAEQMQHGTPCLAYSFKEKDKIRVNKEKIEKLGLKGKLVGELAKGNDIIWNEKVIKAKNYTYKQKGKKISIIFDTAFNNNAIKLARDSDLLICESTYSENEKELAKEYKHLTAKEAGKIAKKAKIKKLILTHISQRYENKEKILLNEAKKEFKKVEIAEDFKKIEL